MFPVCRFSLNCYQECDKDGTIIKERRIEPTHYATYVTDSGKNIKLIGIRESDADFEVEDEHERLAIAWLEENYPDYKNPLAYWD